MQGGWHSSFRGSTGGVSGDLTVGLPKGVKITLGGRHTLPGWTPLTSPHPFGVPPRKISGPGSVTVRPLGAREGSMGRVNPSGRLFVWEWERGRTTGRPIPCGVWGHTSQRGVVIGEAAFPEASRQIGPRARPIIGPGNGDVGCPQGGCDPHDPLGLAAAAAA
jgi:hypothetical protein